MLKSNDGGPNNQISQNKYVKKKKRSDFTEKIKIRIYAHHAPFDMLNFLHKEKFYIYAIVLTGINKLYYLSLTV